MPSIPTDEAPAAQLRDGLLLAGVALAVFREALAAVAGEHFDLLIADITLSDGDGCELLVRPAAPSRHSARSRWRVTTARKSWRSAAPPGSRSS